MLTLWAGEICGFVGANGAGKTTALRMLAGILKPDRGGGHILGFVLQREAADIRERVGYMSQRLSLYAELSVFENLRFRAAVYGLRNPRAAAEAAMRDFNLVPWAHSPAASLSGGWARRLQLAASLLHSPQLVLLDEPTAGPPAEIAAGSPAAVFLLSGSDVRRLANDVTAVAGVVASCPQGACLRVVADPLVELDLRRFAAIHAASLSRAETRLEDAVLVRSLSIGSRQT
jgi:predicted ABC-type transport system involved in lysophospholipase L1 biosynthesis ATPase subunit